jgi:hypothetical protein
MNRERGGEFYMTKYTKAAAKKVDEKAVLRSNS